MIKTVIFDLDNTLYECIGTDSIVVQEDMTPYVERSFGWSREEYEKRLEEVTEELIAIAGCTGTVRNRVIRYQLMMEKAGFPIHPYVMEMYELYWHGMFSRMKPYPGARELLEELRRRGIRIGIGTDLTAEIQYRKLMKLGLIDCIDFIVTSEEASMEKPSEIFFKRCAGKIRCAPQECLFVGDRIDKDVDGAFRAGMHALHFDAAKDSIKEKVLHFIETENPLRKSVARYKDGKRL